MDPMLLVAAGFLVVCFLLVVPRLRERYEARHESDREFLAQQRPRAWEFVGGVTRDDDATEDRPPGYCPRCGTDNEPAFRYCRNCDRRLPVREE